MPELHEPETPSAAGRRRLLSGKGEPLLVADWDRTLFLHYAVDPEALQRETPFALDLWEGRALFSLVAFTLRGMRPHRGGRWTQWLTAPIATHEFLNARIYVQHAGEPGIQFLAEWLPNPLSVRLGPILFGLPYRRGQLEYQHAHETGRLQGCVCEANTALRYTATLPENAAFQPACPGSLTEFLLERYTAFTALHGKPGYFRVWHPPWEQIPAQVDIERSDLLTKLWPWFREAEYLGANYSPGARNVWMGRPYRLTN